MANAGKCRHIRVQNWHIYNIKNDLGFLALALKIEVKSLSV